jgi:multifunctional 2-oxoglutarate metabolism enzyme
MAARTKVEITMPQMGESVTEGVVLEWRKAAGQRVERDEPLVEVSTDKVDTDVPAPASGTLARILAEPDQTVQVGEVLGEIEVGEAEPAAPEAGAGDGAPPAEADLIEVTFPQMGDSVSEGTVIEWRKRAGEPVEADEALVEVSTDKVDAEVPAPVAGTLAEIVAEPDETVPVGAVLGRIAPAPAAAAGGPVQPAAEAIDVRREGAAPTAGNGAHRATPVAARIASAHGLDLSEVSGSGPRRSRRARPDGHTGPGGDPRALHEREPLDPHRNELPHGPGDRARRAPGRAQGGRLEAVLHPSDRLGDREGRG